MASDSVPDSSEKTKQAFTDNLDVVFNYVRSKTYPENFSREDKKQLRRKAKNFVIQDSSLLYRLNGNYVRVITDQQERLRIVQAVHEGLGETKQSKALGGHHGRDKTSRKITERYFWPGVVSDVKYVIDHCDECQRVNRRFEKVPSKLHNIPVTPQPWRQIGIDLLGPLPETPEGYKYIVTVIDYYTKWPEAAPLKNKTATAVAEFLYHLICRHGCPEIEISDQGREFVNQVQQELHRLTGVEHRIASAYHPQTNGLVERQNQTTQKDLLKQLGESQDQWEKVLDGVLFAYRTAIHASTGYSPFFLLYGRHPRLPIDVEMNQQGSQDSAGAPSESNIPNPSVEEMVERMKTIRQAADGKAMTNIKKAQARQKKHYDKRQGSAPVIGVGEKVLKQNMRNTNRVGGTMDARWTGPYMVTASGKQGVYRLKNLRTKMLLKRKVNATQLKRYREPLNIGRPGNTERDISYNLRVREGRTTNENITSRPKRGNEGSQSDPPSKKARQPEESTEPQAKVIITEVSPEPETLPFHPVNQEWQERMCQEFKLTRVDSHSVVASKDIEICAPPKTSVKIQGDGNCFFRTVSYLVTGNQKNHKQMRDMVVNYLQDNSEVFRKVHNNSDYVNESCMNNPGEWATEVEIIATASLFATEIYYFSQYGRNNKWIKYGLLRGATRLINNSKRKMYISNINEHFVPVLDV